MILYLVQHGEALPETVDAAKSLSPVGTVHIQALAAACRRFGVSAREVVHSGKRRAEQTAEILGQALGLRPRAAVGLDPADPVMPVAAECQAMEEDRIIVGHMPFLGRLATLLLAGREDPPAVAFQRGGMVCLEKRGAGEWILLWTLFPRQPR